MNPPIFSLTQISARSAPPPLRAAYPPLRDALTRERRPAKRNLRLASAQVNGRVVLTMMRSLAGEGFRLERLPLRVTVRRGCCCALLRVRGVRLSSKRNGAAAFVGARAGVNAVVRHLLPFGVRRGRGLEVVPLATVASRGMVRF